MGFETENARALLAFYRDAGVDALLGEAPIDRFADDLPPAAPLEGTRSAGNAARSDTDHPTDAQGAVPPDRVQRSDASVAADAGIRGGATPASPEAAVISARAAAKTAESLEALRGLLETFEGCMLRSTATQLVFADGNPKGRVMFVGEAPGRDEDIAGVPFVGRSGKLLDLMMQAIGLDRTQAYIANIVPWRPPGNRTPTPHESAICLPFLLRQIELADPDILVCLGQPSTQTLLGTREGITRTRGRWFKFDTGRREIRALATYHPAFLLRSPLQKRLAWRDFLALKKALAA
jgi:uracil-DNA glycosylase